MGAAEEALEPQDAAALCAHGWEKLREGRHLEALADFCSAIELNPKCAEAYNKRGIVRQILGLDFEGDFDIADQLSQDDPKLRKQLLDFRKWQPAGWETGRMEAEGEKHAKDADFLISFASPDTQQNNRILHRLKKSVLFNGKISPVSFCTDRSLGMGVHIVPGEALRRFDPKYSSLDDPRQPGDFPNWFKHYQQAAKETRHGILILQLTEGYFKSVSQVIRESKACRWEFGYLRKPELVHVFVNGVDGPQIVRWEDLTTDAALCSRAFGIGGPSQEALQQAADDMFSQSAKADLAHEKVVAAADLVEEQEYQVAFALTRNQEKTEAGIEAANKLATVYLDTGQAQRAAELGTRMLEVVEEMHGPEEFMVGNILNNLGNAYGKLGDYQKQKGFLERSLKINEQHYGKEHTQVAMTLHNLGTAYGELGDYQKQKEFLERSLKITEQHYGKEHPEVAGTLHNLGTAYGELGDYQKKKDFLERSRKINEQHYGAEHPEVAITLGDLADACGNLGDYQTQQEFLER
ncbi:unnamed protein product, partial [Symbiodinium necroappetens]